METLCRDCGSRPDAVLDACPACGSSRVVRHRELHDLAIAHLDCDAFYAAIEKRDRPELRDRPVIVGGHHRGVVAACCYLARTSGVRSAMPMFKALEACPEAAVVRPDMKKYAAVGREVRAMMTSLTPLVEPLSIDEAFMDLSGTKSLHRASPAATLAALARRVEAELSITLSIGLSYNKFLAKIASDLDKPRVFPGGEAGQPAVGGGPLMPGRRPAHGQASPLDGAGRVDGDGCGTAAWRADGGHNQRRQKGRGAAVPHNWDRTGNPARGRYISLSDRMRLILAPRAPRRRGEPAVRESRRQRLGTVRREAPGPWRTGGEDDAGIHVLDVNGERVATIWKMPSRSDSTLEAIQALMVRMGDEVLAQRLRTNPECRRPFDAPSRTQKHCSSSCSMATQPHVIEARKRDARAFELRLQGFTWKEVAKRCGLRDGKRASLGARKHAASRCEFGLANRTA